jgi:hypothetical protein
MRHNLSVAHCDASCTAKHLIRASASAPGVAAFPDCFDQGSQLAAHSRSVTLRRQACVSQQAAEVSGFLQIGVTLEASEARDREVGPGGDGFPDDPLGLF